jgi:DNA-binding NtrC family response regulator
MCVTASNKADTRDRILVIDDEARVASIVQIALEAAGWMATVVTSGDQAVALVKQDPATYSVVLLDVLMRSGLSGPETLRQMRACGATMGVVFMTGGNISAEELKEMRPCEILYKPFEIDTLIATVRRCAEENKKHTALPPPKRFRIKIGLPHDR